MMRLGLTSAAAILAALSLLAPARAADTPPETAKANSADTYRQLDLFGEVFERVRADYVENVTDEQLIEAAINGMLSSLDPHSSYMNAKIFGDMEVQVRGEFGGAIDAARCYRFSFEKGGAGTVNVARVFQPPGGRACQRDPHAIVEGVYFLGAPGRIDAVDCSVGRAEVLESRKV